MMKRRFLSAWVALCLANLVGPAWALDKPTERPILVVTGKIGTTNAPEGAQFDMKMLAALPQHSFTTRTPWYDQPMRFTGPLLSDVLEAVQAQGSMLEATAINDYKVRIPVDDARKFKVILARLLNDQPMKVREKGPLFVVYPFDSERELRSSTYYERSIWQLKALDIQ